ncbi:MutS-related protein [Flavitalea antarctica]
MLSPEAFYKENLQKYEAALKKVNSRLLLTATFRGLFFLAACWLIYRGIKEPSGNAAVAGAGISIVLFIISLRLALNLRDQKNLIEKILYVNNNELSILEGGPNKFDNGASNINPGNYSVDLDIFGPGSLYGLLNRTTTKLGSEFLSRALQQPILEKETIESYQQAVKVIAAQPQQRQLITAHGLLHDEREGTLYDIRIWLKETNRMLSQKWLQVVRYLVPAFNIWAFYHFLDTDNVGPLLIGLALAWLIIGIFSKYIFAQHALITKKQAILDQYAGILKQFSHIDPGTAELLTDARQQATDASTGIYKLARLSSLFDQRLNLIVFVVLNGFFLYDIQVMLKLEGWKSTYKNSFDTWIDIVGRIELLNSLGSFCFNNPGYAFPLVHEEMSVLAKEMAHPLIPPSVNVPNPLDFGRKEKLIILTGSNMSGKTTFLRTLGVNLVLAQCGAPVNAKEFVFRPMIILSSIRVGDSLQENTSYFMAELKKLRAIIDKLETGVPALVLIDEILRGTNSDDKTHGSEQFIKKLINFRCLTLFATHDLSLSVLEQELPGLVDNYCFESIINDGELLFDYTLRQGVARNKNASFLMKKMGIIRE